MAGWWFRQENLCEFVPLSEGRGLSYPFSCWPNSLDPNS